VRSKPFLILSGDIPLSARLYRATGDLTERQPALIVTGAWLTVKEQMPHRYAELLAARGYTVLTFDFAGFGESGGSPRQAEIPARKIADITSAVRYLSTLSFVRPGGIGYLAICGSAQYTLRAIADGAPINSFASVAGWYHDTPTVAPFYGGMDGVNERIIRADDALDEFLRTGDVRMVPAYENGNDRAGMFFELEYYGKAERGAVPEWRNEMAEFSWLYWLTFDGLSAAARVSVPSLFVHSDDCVLPDNVKAVHQRVTGPSELVWAEGTQTDFYDQPAQVELAVDAADRHFRETL
jgi:fermentation-respiration switch protein FrsA (DUF1100 family)